MDVDIKVDGMKDIEKQLLKLGAVGAIKELNSALMSASKPTYDRARRNASFSNKFVGAIRRRKQRTFNKKKGKLNLQKGFRRSAAGTNRATGVSIEVAFKKAPHFHLIEFGTDSRKNKRGANRGKVTPGRFMMTRAFEGNAPKEATDIFKKRMQSKIKRLIKKGQLKG